MKRPLAVAVVALSFGPSCVFAQERAGDAALGALSGAVVLGPVGAVAGALIGFTAGPAISRSWGTRGPEPRRENSPKRSASAVSTGAPAQSANRPAPASQPGATEKGQQPAAAPPEPAATEKPVPATSLGPEAENSMPPVQTLE